jgi:hypothetical protein
MRGEESLSAVPDKAAVQIPAAGTAWRERSCACEDCGADATRYVNVEGIKTHLCDGCAAKHRTRPPDPQ